MKLGRNTPRTEPMVPRVQYFNGLVSGKQPGQSRFLPGLTGFAIEIGRYGDEIDRAAHGAGLARVDVSHPREGGKAEICAYWYIGEHITLYPLTTGPSVIPMASLVRHASEAAEAGLGVRWQRGRSVLAVRCYHPDLIAAGYDGLLQISVSGIMTDYLLRALAHHVGCCAQADALARTKDPDASVDCYELAWPLRAAVESVAFGREQTAQVVPIVSGHPDPVDLTYLRRVYLRNGESEPGRTIRAAIHRDWATTQDWAARFGQSDESDDRDGGV